MSAGITIDIQNACASDGDPAEDDIRSWIISVLDRCGSGGALEVSVRIVGEDESRQLNNDYRSKDDELWAAARSRHPGGVNAAMADGSVNFYTDDIDLDVWKAVATRSGRELVQTPK